MKDQKKALTILKKVYHYENTDYDTDYDGIVGHKTDFLTEEQKQILVDSNLVPNTIKTCTHNEYIEDFLVLQQNEKLTLDFAKALFLKGLTGDSPRYRQTLISVLYLKNIKKHDFVPSKTSADCSICGLPQVATEDKTNNLRTYYHGGSWNELPFHFVTELEDILQYPKPEVTAEDKEYLIRLLLAIANGPENEAPSKLEKRIGKEKLLPKTDKYSRYGILQTLAILEILPSDEALDKESLRSDIVFPLAGWNGKLGVNFQKANNLFDLNLPTKK